MVMSPHALIPSATPFGLENVKLLRRNKDANALFAHFGEMVNSSSRRLCRGLGRFLHDCGWGLVGHQR